MIAKIARHITLPLLLLCWPLLARAGDGAIQATLNEKAAEWTTSTNEAGGASEYFAFRVSSGVNLFGSKAGEIWPKESFNMEFNFRKAADGFTVDEAKIYYLPNGISRDLYFSRKQETPEITVLEAREEAGVLHISGSFTANLYKVKNQRSINKPDLNDKIAVKGRFQAQAVKQN